MARKKASEPRMQDNDRAALSNAFFNGDEAAIRAALAAGADPNAADPDGELAIVHASKRADTERVALLQLLGADPNAADERGWSAIAIAAQTDEPDMLWTMLRGGARPDGDGTLIGTPIFLASFEGLDDNLRLLMGAGADLTAVDRDSGRTALMLAIQNGNDRCAKLLVDAGCPILAVDRSGSAAIDHARAEERADVLEWLEPIVAAHQERAALELASAAGSAPSQTSRL
jgi:ankyrin repeat protein